MTAAVDGDEDLEVARGVARDRAERDLDLDALADALAAAEIGAAGDARGVRVVDAEAEAARESRGARSASAAGAEVSAGAATLGEELRLVHVHGERRAAAGEADPEVGGKALVKGHAVARAIVAHAVEAVEVDVGVVAAELVLASGDAVDEDLELVEVGLEVARDDEVEEARVDLRVERVDLGAVRVVDHAEVRVAEAGLRVLHGDGRAVGGVSRAIESDLGLGGAGNGERGNEHQLGTHLSDLLGGRQTLVRTRVYRLRDNALRATRAISKSTRETHKTERCTRIPRIPQARFEGYGALSSRSRARWQGRNR